MQKTKQMLCFTKKKKKNTDMSLKYNPLNKYNNLICSNNCYPISFSRTHRKKQKNFPKACDRPKYLNLNFLKKKKLLKPHRKQWIQFTNCVEISFYIYVYINSKYQCEWWTCNWNNNNFRGCSRPLIIPHITS